MKRILIGWMAALSALLCACSAQTVWETVDGGCVPAEGGAAYAIRIALPQDAVEESDSPVDCPATEPSVV